MTDDGNETKKYLTRDVILKIENEPKIYQLPSGQTVCVAFLSLSTILEIQERIASGNDDKKAQEFTKKVIEQMLRVNNQKDYRTFSSEDQIRLIELATEEWGCEEEYKQLVGVEVPDERFYLAVQQQEKELTRHLAETARAITANLAITMMPLRSIQMELASSMKGMIDAVISAESSKLGEAFNLLNARAIEQIGDISRFQIPILGMAEEITKIPLSSVIPAQKDWLESMRGTITSYQSLMKEILPFEKFAILPDAVRYYPTIEMRNTSIVATQLLEEYTNQPQEDIITPNKTELLAWLESADPTFPNMLLGAEQAILSKNPDHRRHFASSHRELATHILHLLAPDGEVKRWTKDTNHFDKDGKPFRRTRLKYIARNHSNKTFVDFLIKDFENQMELLNADEHRKDQEYTIQELIALHKRFLSMLGFLQQIVSSHS